MTGALRGYLFLSFLCIGSLFALIGLKQFFVSPLPNPLYNGVWFSVQVLPLVLLLPGLLRSSGAGGRLAFFLATMVGMLYFCYGVWAAAEAGNRDWGLWLTGFALALVALGSLATRALAKPP